MPKPTMQNPFHRPTILDNTLGRDPSTINPPPPPAPEPQPDEPTNNDTKTPPTPQPGRHPHPAPRHTGWKPAKKPRAMQVYLDPVTDAYLTECVIKSMRPGLPKVTKSAVIRHAVAVLSGVADPASVVAVLREQQ